MPQSARGRPHREMQGPRYPRERRDFIQYATNSATRAMGSNITSEIIAMCAKATILFAYAPQLGNQAFELLAILSGLGDYQNRIITRQ